MNPPNGTALASTNAPAARHHRALSARSRLSIVAAVLVMHGPLAGAAEAEPPVSRSIQRTRNPAGRLGRWQEGRRTPIDEFMKLSGFYADRLACLLTESRKPVAERIDCFAAQ